MLQNSGHCYLTFVDITEHITLDMWTFFISLLWQNVRLVFSRTHAPMEDVRVVQPTPTLQGWVQISAQCAQWAPLCPLIILDAVKLNFSLLYIISIRVFKIKSNKWWVWFKRFKRFKTKGSQLHTSSKWVLSTLWRHLIFVANVCILPKIYNRVQHQPNVNLIIHHTEYFPTR